MRRFPVLGALAALIFTSACGAELSSDDSSESSAAFYPASDPANEGGWVLNTEISDEFEGDKIDEDKWLVQGRGGNYYIWKGRAPSQFAPHNVIVEDGKLKLRSQWEPDFEFAKEAYADGSNNDTYGVFEGKPLPVTTAAVVSKKRFLNGYMEVKSKAGDSNMTAAFWAIGHQQELDIFEQMGKPKIEGSISEKMSKMTVHDWSPPALRPTRAFVYADYLDYRVADEFHIYGAEWGRDYLTIYRDGKQVYHIEQKDIGTDWVLNNPMEIWLDSEIFKWLGLPHKEELPTDFEIEYIRVWQKPSDNLLDEHRAFYGFEGPILYQENPRPWTMLPEDLDSNDYQKFWIIDENSEKNFRIVENRWHSGVNSLKYVTFGDKKDIQIVSPEGAIDLPAGEYELSFKIWVNYGKMPKHLHMMLKSPKVQIKSFNIPEIDRDEWVTLKARFKKDTASSDKDQLELKILGKEIPAGAGDFYIDDIEIREVS